jgi:enediyne biosynthesis protein E4
MRLKRAVVLMSLVALAGCGDRAVPPPAAAPASSSGNADSEWFTDRAKETGLDFVHVNGMSGGFSMAEILAPGVAVFDYDNDGDLDVYLVQGQMLGPKPPDPALRGRLYRNDLEVHADGTRSLRFTDVTDASGIDARGYGMGVAAGDINNDGCVDLYLTGFGDARMYRNNCDGTFTDVTRQSGTANPGWSVSAAFVDFDRDGWLDLYVGNYLRYTLASDTTCFSPSGARDYCTPKSFPALPDRLYRNQHDGTFADVSARAGIAREFGPALGIVTADFNGDGWIDIYVANDGKDNQLWINQRNGTFVNTALLSGAALTAEGRAEASMGVDADDFDNDGDEDLFMTEQTGEGANLYVNDGTGTFEDRSLRSGLGAATLPYTGFGTAWVDVDNDGRLDILTVNGAVQTIQALAQAHDRFPLHQRKQLLHNLGDGTFEDITPRGGAVFQLSEVSRGAAFGDIDNDGDVDVVVGNNNGATRLMINNVGSRAHWLGLRLTGGQSVGGRLRPEQSAGRDMLGARVEIVRSNAPTLVRRAHADGSYASASDPRVLVGLGESKERPTVRVRWPGGRVEEWHDVPIDRYTTLKEGTAK